MDTGNIRPLTRPVKYKLYRLPKIERKYPSPYNFKIIFGYNPNKCTVSWIKKTILFDDNLKEKTVPELFFILYHEYGHKKYKTEKYADLYATNMMLKKGYNPSQIGAAPVTSLSSKQLPRKKYIVNKILKHSKRKKLKNAKSKS